MTEKKTGETERIRLLKKHIERSIERETNPIKAVLTTEDLKIIRYVTKMICQLSGFDFELFEEEYIKAYDAEDFDTINDLLNPIIYSSVYYLKKYTRIPDAKTALYFPHLKLNPETSVERIMKQVDNVLGIAHTFEKVGDTISDNLLTYARSLRSNIGRLQITVASKYLRQIKLTYKSKIKYYNLLSDMYKVGLNIDRDSVKAIELPNQVRHLYKPTELELLVTRADFSYNPKFHASANQKD